MQTNRKDLPFHINPAQVKELIRLAEFRESDVFYDMGCGKGQVVIQVIKETNVKKAVGIELEQAHYEAARKAANNQLSLAQVQKLDFWFGAFNDTDDDDNFYYDVSDATIIYYSLHEEADTIDYFKDMFGKKHIRIITKDLPFVGYASEANRENGDCWFFRMRYPLKRIRKEKEWVESVLGQKDLTMDHVFSYFGDQLSKRRAYSKKDVTESVLDLEKVVNRRFQ